jgi:hypothetical protein
LFSIDRRNNILLTVDGSSVERRCETICPAALNSRSTAAELHGIAKYRFASRDKHGYFDSFSFQKRSGLEYISP